MATVKTFRFEFSKEFIGELSRFSKVHQFDERRAYKESWQRWKMNPEIEDVIAREMRRLEEGGYKGDIEDKMFKSGRYYFRKKSINADTNIINNNTIINNTIIDNNNIIKNKLGSGSNSSSDFDKNNESGSSSSSSTTIIKDDECLEDDVDVDERDHVDEEQNQQPPKKPQQQRRPYITMSKSCIRMMDAHIEKFSKTPEFKPSTSYDSFYQEKMSTAEMMAEIELIIQKYEKTLQVAAEAQAQHSTENVVTPSLESIMSDIMDKIKKTYKNRYYRFVNK
jgi:hypothetical protein